MAESSLPSTFTFSQASLQDYADCQRRFQLRYVLRVRWPAAHDEPATERERRMQKGADFHHLIHQHTLGFPVEVLSAVAGNRTPTQQGDLRRWWNAYLTTPPPNLPTALRRAEVRLSTPLNGYPMPPGNYYLSARYDLLAIAPGQRAVIVDWKTDRTRPKRTWLAKRWQTLAYRYVLVRAGTQLHGNTPIAPAQVEMIYWFANFPGQVEQFPYSAEQHTAAESTLLALIAEIATHNEEVWFLTDKIEHCRYCAYRTLCDREKTAGKNEEIRTESDEDLFDFDLDLEQIAEIEF